MERLRRKIECVHTDLDPLRSSFAQVLCDPPQPLVLRRIEPGPAEHDRIHHALRAKPFRSLDDSRIAAFAEHHTRPTAGSAVEQLDTKAHERKRRASAVATTGCTMGLTSP